MIDHDAIIQERFAAVAEASDQVGRFREQTSPVLVNHLRGKEADVRDGPARSQVGIGGEVRGSEMRIGEVEERELILTVDLRVCSSRVLPYFRLEGHRKTPDSSATIF